VINIFREYLDKDGDVVYDDETILPSKQTIRIVFYEVEHNNRYYYDIYVVTMHKKKAIDSTILKTTGKDGVAGLLWAKNKIKEFEILIKEIHENVTICIYWDDNRRRNIYEWGLRKEGYKMGRIFDKKCLCKKI